MLESRVDDAIKEDTVKQNEVSRRSLVFGGVLAASSLVVSRGLAFEPVSHSFEDSDMCVATDDTTEGPYYADKDA